MRKRFLAVALFSAALLIGVLAYAFPSLRYGEFRISESETARQSQSAASPAPGGRRIPIIIYHAIHPVYAGETAAQRAFNVSPDLFEQQLAYLKSHGYSAISLDELVAELKTGTTTPAKKQVVLTFDDGWRDQYTAAVPLLKKYHDTATFYVYTNPIGADARFLTWDEIKEMIADGMTIGSHTLSHPYLSRLTPEKLRHEVFDSKRILEEHLGKPVVHFASPFGYTSDRLTALLADAGYATGRTTYKGAFHTEDDLLHLSGYFAPQTLNDFIWIVGYAP